MKKIKLPLLIFGLLAIFSLIPATTTFARNGSAENETSTEVESEQRSSLEQQKKEIEAKREQIKQEAEQKREDAKQKAEELLAQKKSEFKERTAEQKQKSCEQISANLTKKLENGISRAARHKGTFDNHLNRIQEFKSKKKLEVANYDVLLANTAAASAQSQASIDALKSFTPKVDCTNLGATTSNVAGYKEAINKAKTDLKAYRQYLKDLLIAVRQSAEAAKTENSEANQ